MIRPFVAVLALCAAACSARAQPLVRVAVAKGPALSLQADRLSLSTHPDESPVEVEREATFDPVGPLVLSGERLAAEWLVRSADGGPLRVGTRTAGAVRVVSESDGLVAIEDVALETYVAAVVSAEMPLSWPAAALEAQAIAARTYALRRLNASPDRAYDMESSVLHQVYAGSQQLDPRALAAVEATRGKVLEHGGQLADTFFFASCVGRTESADAAFGRGAPYLVPVKCEESEPERVRWEKRIDVATLGRRLLETGELGDTLVRVEVAGRTKSGRVATVRLVTKRSSRVLPASDLRRIVGYTELPSLDFDVKTSGGQLVFKGAGAGHAVGLCQRCARTLALKGRTAEAILAHHYPGTKLVLRE